MYKAQELKRLQEENKKLQEEVDGYKLEIKKLKESLTDTSRQYEEDRLMIIKQFHNDKKKELTNQDIPLL